MIQSTINLILLSLSSKFLDISKLALSKCSCKIGGPQTQTLFSSMWFNPPEPEFNIKLSARDSSYELVIVL